MRRPPRGSSGWGGIVVVVAMVVVGVVGTAGRVDVGTAAGCRLVSGPGPGVPVEHPATAMPNSRAAASRYHPRTRRCPPACSPPRERVAFVLATVTHRLTSDLGSDSFPCAS
jgi:hypothetical protein